MSGLSVAQALAELDGIDRSMGAFERTAPDAFAAFGGRDALLAASQATCVGPIPRLTDREWSSFSAEHVELQREMRAAARDPRAGRVYAGQEPGADVIPSSRVGPMLSRS